MVLWVYADLAESVLDAQHHNENSNTAVNALGKGTEAPSCTSKKQEGTDPADNPHGKTASNEASQVTFLVSAVLRALYAA